MPDWAAIIDRIGHERGLNPLLRETFEHYLATGCDPAIAARRALVEVGPWPAIVRIIADVTS